MQAERARLGFEILNARLDVPEPTIHPIEARVDAFGKRYEALLRREREAVDEVLDPIELRFVVLSHWSSFAFLAVISGDVSALADGKAVDESVEAAGGHPGDIREFIDGDEWAVDLAIVHDALGEFRAKAW